jgi:DNA-binding transcriptional LysR family regulator
MRAHLLATGRFVTVLPESVIRCNAKHWGLKALPVDLGVPSPSVAIITLKGRTAAPVTGLFIEQTREAAREISSAWGRKTSLSR